MPALTSDQRIFLSQPYRYVEVNDPSIQARHPTAREMEYTSGFVTIGSAQIAVLIINAVTSGDRRLVTATADGIIPLSFRGRPPTCLLRTARYGYSRFPGRLMLVEGVALDHGAKKTTLTLSG